MKVDGTERSNTAGTLPYQNSRVPAISTWYLHRRDGYYSRVDDGDSIDMLGTHRELLVLMLVCLISLYCRSILRLAVSVLHYTRRESSRRALPFDLAAPALYSVLGLAALCRERIPVSPPPHGTP